MLQRFRESIGRWVAIAILALIAVTFVFFGVDFSLTGATFAAKVNGEEIPLTEFDRELQAQQAQFAQEYGMELDEEMRGMLRRNVIERLVSLEALEQRVEDVGYRVSDRQLRDYIRSISAFQVGGQFSVDAYRSMLAAQGFSPASFEAAQRTQLALQELQTGIASSAFMTPTEFRSYIELIRERRRIGYALFSVEDFLDEVEVADEAVRAYYDANGAQYVSEETVDLEYIEVTQSDIAAQIDITEEELRAYYEDERQRYETAEERRVSHILVQAGDDPAAAQAQAQAARERIEAGEDFADVAADVSDDAGTASQGGDLGWIGRGVLEGPFEDTLYEMEVGEIAGPVETDFGFHVLRLEDVRAGDVEPFDAVRDELLVEYQNRLAEDLFFERANQLADAAFDAYDELASVAMQVDLPLQRVEDFPRSGDSSRFPNSAAIVQAAFEPEMLEERINSPLIELSDDHVMVLRVTDHDLPEQLPFEAVEERITDDLARERARDLADQAVTVFVEDVEAGADWASAAEEHGGTWNEPVWVERAAPDLPSELLATAFSLPAPGPDEDPVHERVPLATGDEAVLQLLAAEPGDPENIPSAEREQLRMQLESRLAATEFEAYASQVREAASVRIPDEVLSPTR